jgi:integrase/recombinase XerD
VRVDQCVEIYVQKKKDCGYSYNSIAKLLRRFAQFTGRLNISLVTTERVSQFLCEAPISNNTSRAYTWQLRNFFRYWHGRRQIGTVPDVPLKPPMAQTFVPYVYTRQDIRALLDATSICQRGRKCLISPAALRTLILFLYGTGIRIGDALALSSDHVDLVGSTIIVRGTTVLERTIPIGRDVRSVLSGYLDSDERSRFGRAQCLFLNTKGKPIRYGIVCTTFNRLRKLSGVKRADSTYQPRMHDLRHSFAVHSIAKWNTSGLDLDHVLPMLATYMGNLDMHGLERYLELSPCNYENTLKRLYSFRRPPFHRKRA